MPVGVLQRLLQSFLLGHVLNNTGDESARMTGNRAKADLSGELAAVFAHCPQVQGRSHGASVGMSRESGAVASVTVSESFGHQDIDLLAHQLLPPVTEHPFGLTIHLNDLAVVIDNDHRIRGGLRKVVEPRVF